MVVKLKMKVTLQSIKVCLIQGTSGLSNSIIHAIASSIHSPLTDIVVILGTTLLGVQLIDRLRVWLNRQADQYFIAEIIVVISPGATEVTCYINLLPSAFGCKQWQ